MTHPTHPEYSPNPFDTPAAKRQRTSSNSHRQLMWSALQPAESPTPTSSNAGSDIRPSSGVANQSSLLAQAQAHVKQITGGMVPALAGMGSMSQGELVILGVVIRLMAEMTKLQGQLAAGFSLSASDMSVIRAKVGKHMSRLDLPSYNNRGHGISDAIWKQMVEAEMFPRSLTRKDHVKTTVQKHISYCISQWKAARKADLLGSARRQINRYDLPTFTKRLFVIRSLPTSDQMARAALLARSWNWRLISLNAISLLGFSD
ncbi:hypothetical protein DFJ77DRAFT_514265 [Powellomyces hirtus]|nr:hypothetical protein DFJ77DRAFT_514265 [Powellomyces hirtus]